MRRCLLAVLLGLLVSPLTPAHAQTQSWLDGMETVTEKVARDVRHVADNTAQMTEDDFLEPATAEFPDATEPQDAVFKPIIDIIDDLTNAARNGNHVVTPFGRQPDAIVTGHANHATTARSACTAASRVIGTFLQQQSGTATATADTRADACEVAQARAVSAADQSCDGPFDVDDCQCSQDRNSEFEPYSCSARWRCQS